MEQERDELVLGCQSETGFEGAGSAIFHQDSKRRVEMCSSRAVHLERRTASDGHRLKRSFWRVQRCSRQYAGFLAKSEEKEMSQASYSMLNMWFEGALAIHKVMCSRTANCDGICGER
jgi:hypothetical protein